MTKIYTKNGDMGETGLVGGKRVSKADDRIDLYGEVDELNSRIGMAVSLMAPAMFGNEIQFLHEIQSALFDLGSNLACEPGERANFKLPHLSAGLVTKLETAIDSMEKSLSPLKNFILPGGPADASALHLCRTGSRNVERKLVAFLNKTNETAPDNSVEFLNRLSDYFFTVARFVTNKQNQNEILWKPFT